MDLRRIDWTSVDRWYEEPAGGAAMYTRRRTSLYVLVVAPSVVRDCTRVLAVLTRPPISRHVGHDTCQLCNLGEFPVGIWDAPRAVREIVKLAMTYFFRG